MTTARVIARQPERSSRRGRAHSSSPAVAPAPASPWLQRKPACACGGGCSRCTAKAGETEALSHAPQAKLVVGASHDPLEGEADRIADHVLAAPVPRAGAPPQIRRQMRDARPANEAGDVAPATTAPVLASPGSPLDPPLRREMEQRFGRDLSRVRVHSGTAAEQSARDLNANAYTVGRHIVFGADQFAPGTHEGRRLIAHELTHVAQQAGGDAPPHVQRQPKAAPKPAPQPASNPLCTRMCAAATPATPQKVTIGQNVFTLCPCTAKQVNFNTGPGYVNWVTKTSGGLLSIDSSKVNFRTGFQGKQVSNTTPAWEYTAGVGVDEVWPFGGATRETELFTGFIQTIESYKWNAVYGNGWERNLSESNVRDAQPGATAPWYGVAGGHDAPQQVGTQVNVTDEPQVIVSVVHPDPAATCAKLQEITTEGTFNMWLIAAETANATTNLASLYHATITFDRKFVLTTPGAEPSNTLNWTATGSQTESNAGYGAGSKTPVLNTPVATLAFTTKTGTPCPGAKKSDQPSQ